MGDAGFMEKTVAAMGIVCATFALCCIVSFVPAWLWYCFDDKLAELVGVPAIGSLPFWNVYAACWFISYLFKGVHIERKAD